MNPSERSARRRRRHSRACALAAIVGIAGHLWMLTAHAVQPWLAAIVLAMAALCAHCVPPLWKRADGRAAPRLLTMSLAMALFHAAMILATGHSGMSGMHASGPAHEATAVPAMRPILVVIALELAIAFLAATLIGSLRRRQDPASLE